MRPDRFVLLAVFATAAPAWASQAPGAPGVNPPLLMGTEPGIQTPPSDAGIHEDPYADRSVLLPTALTQPAGTVSVTSYELLLAGLTVGVTDRLQVSVTGLVAPIFGSHAAIGNLKWQALRVQSLRLAVNAGVTYSRSEPDEHHLGPNDPHPGIDYDFMPHLGATASICLSDDCHSLVSFNIQALSTASRQGIGEVGLVYGGSAIGRVTPHVKLVLELASTDQWNTGPEDGNGLMGTLAVRFFHEHVALDGGLFVFVEDGHDSVPLPYFALGVRF